MCVTEISSTEGILLTGGDGADTSVEVILSDSSICSLPPLPDGRRLHSQSGLTVCGGESSSQTCSSFRNGEWTISHNLIEERIRHVSWSSPSGIILLGGLKSEWTTELLTSTSSTSYNIPVLFDIK